MVGLELKVWNKNLELNWRICHLCKLKVEVKLELDVGFDLEICFSNWKCLLYHKINIALRKKKYTMSTREPNQNRKLYHIKLTRLPVRRFNIPKIQYPFSSVTLSNKNYFNTQEITFLNYNFLLSWMKKNLRIMMMILKSIEEKTIAFRSDAIKKNIK